MPHPFDRARNGSRLQTPALERLVAAGLIDAIEVFNARATFAEDNARALAFARQHGLPMSAGSDAHTLWEVGRAYVEMPPFATAAEFLAELRAGRVGGALSSRSSTYRAAGRRARRSCAWPTPRARCASAA